VDITYEPSRELNEILSHERICGATTNARVQAGP
jgi:hypothetical protein